jgi:hypothetical protein
MNDSLDTSTSSAITRLPTELLSTIFTYVAPVREWYWDVLADEWTILPLVCQRWRDTAEPFLYRRIDFRETTNNISIIQRQISILRQTLDRRPQLGSHVRTLGLHIRTTDPETWHKLTHIVGRCHRLRWFTIEADFGPHLAVLVRTIPTFPLDRLDLAWFATRPSLEVMLHMAHIPTLQWLTLEALDRHNLPTPRAIWPEDEDEDNVLTSPPASSNIGIAAYRAELPLWIIERIVSWAVGLKSLWLTDVRYSAYGHEYTARAVERMLRTQRTSLTDLQLGILADDDDHLLDLSDFPALDSLRLSAWDTLKRVPASIVQRKLGSPHLRELILSFDMEDHTHCAYTDFDTAEVEWIRDFLGTPNRLESMMIEFWPICPEGVKLAFWPWDRLEEAAGLAGEVGVVLEYSMAPYEREELENPGDWDELYGHMW